MPVPLSLLPPLFSLSLAKQYPKAWNVYPSTLLVDCAWYVEGEANEGRSSIVLMISSGSTVKDLPYPHSNRTSVLLQFVENISPLGSIFPNVRYRFVLLIWGAADRPYGPCAILVYTIQIIQRSLQIVLFDRHISCLL